MFLILAADELGIFEVGSELFQVQGFTDSSVFCWFGLDEVLIAEIVADGVDVEFFYSIGIKQSF